MMMNRLLCVSALVTDECETEEVVDDSKLRAADSIALESAPKCPTVRSKRRVKKPARYRDVTESSHDVEQNALEEAAPPSAQPSVSQRSDSSEVTSCAEMSQVTKRVSKRSVSRTRVPEFPKGCNNWSLEYIATCQKEDNDVSPVRQWVEAGQLPMWERVKGSSPYMRALFRQFDSLVLRDDVLYRVFVDRDSMPSHYQIVIPRKLISPMLTAIHCDAAGHLKYRRSLGLLQEKVWWHTYRTDLNVFIAACGKCCSFSERSNVKQSKLRPSQVGEPCQRFSIDLTGPHVMSNGYVYVLTVIDVFSKFLIAVPLRNKTAEGVVEALMKQVILKWGIPVEILSDCGAHKRKPAIVRAYGHRCFF